MIGQQLGAYTIQSELGSGGMGNVYLALGESGEVAIKVVHPHLLETPGFFKRFMQEAELGKRVRHENVVRTFDVDALMLEGTSHHFMVMEYVQGKNLRELLVELGTIPETLLREIALQTVAGLTAIHAAGIIHRDLKPENILITDDHEIRIMDLGVAKLQEATMAITKEGQFAGSLLYAAPEQFKRDEDVGPLSDLYSLGVMLYELATGQHPFKSDDAASVIAAHLNEVPPSPCDRSEDLSRFFGELVATLLAKQAAERFESAEFLRTVLDESERSAWWTERAPALQQEIARLPKIRVSRETALHGRGDDLALLRDCFAAASAGRGNTVFIEGEPGIGKTRMVDAFLRNLGDEDVHVLYGCYPPSGGMGGLSEAVLGKFGEARLADQLAPYLTVTPSLVPAFAALVKHERPPTGVEPLKGDALQAIVVHLMQALAAEKPTVWIVDDLQFASQETLDFVLAMARGVQEHRVLLVATARPGLGLEAFSRLENFQRRSLGRLSPRDVVRLLGDAFQSNDLAEKLAGKIAVKSDGVPFFIFEMIRGLKDGQFIRETEGGSYVQTQVIDAIEVPSAVKELIEGRMRGLTEDQRAILDAGAVQGMTFDPALVARVLDEKRVRVLRSLAEIERTRGLVRGEAGQTYFDQNQIQEVLYQELPPDLRSEYHTLLAEQHLERSGDDPKGEDAVFLVHHHLRGSHPKQALPHLEPAFDHLEESYRNEPLLDLAKRALEAEGLLAGEQRVEVLLRQAGHLDLLGQRDNERAALDEALALADETGDEALRGKVRRTLGGCFVQTSQIDAAQAMLQESRELARAAGDKKLEAQATGNLGLVFFRLGRYAEAQEHHERHRALAGEIGDRRGEATATGNLGNVFWSVGRYAEAQEHYERARALSREIGDRRGEAIATGNLGGVFAVLGRYAEAQEHYERKRSLSREIGDRPSEAHATGSLGGGVIDLGRYAEAQEHLERARALSREIGDRQGEAVTTLLLGDLLVELGRPAGGREHLERTLVLSREIGLRVVEDQARAALAGLAERDGDGATACRLYQEALPLFRERGDKSGLSSTLVAFGRLEAARRARGQVRVIQHARRLRPARGRTGRSGERRSASGRGPRARARDEEARHDPRRDDRAGAASRRGRRRRAGCVRRT